MRLSWSQTQLFNYCNRAWMWSYYEGLESKEPKPHLQRGRMFHTGIAFFLKHRDVRKAIQQTRDKYFFAGEYELLDEVDSLLNYYLHLIDGWMADKYVVATNNDILQNGDNKLAIEFRLEDENWVGLIDTIVKDIETDQLYIVDWKLRNHLTDPDLALVDGQILTYAAKLDMLNKKHGIYNANIAGGIMVEFKADLPKPARMNKTGVPSTAVQNTTVDMWKATLPSGLRINKDEWARRLFEQGKIKDDSAFMRQHKYILTSEAVERYTRLIVDTRVKIEHAVKVSKAESEFEGIDASSMFTGAFNIHTCRFCDFKPLCISEQTGSDINVILDEMYQPKRYVK